MQIQRELKLKQAASRGGATSGSRTRPTKGGEHENARNSSINSNPASDVTISRPTTPETTGPHNDGVTITTKATAISSSTASNTAATANANLASLMMTAATPTILSSRPSLQMMEPRELPVSPLASPTSSPAQGPVGVVVATTMTKKQKKSAASSAATSSAAPTSSPGGNGGDDSADMITAEDKAQKKTKRTSGSGAKGIRAFMKSRSKSPVGPGQQQRHGRGRSSGNKSAAASTVSAALTSTSSHGKDEPSAGNNTTTNTKRRSLKSKVRTSKSISPRPTKSSILRAQHLANSKSGGASSANTTNRRQAMLQRGLSVPNLQSSSSTPKARSQQQKEQQPSRPSFLSRQQSTKSLGQQSERSSSVGPGKIAFEHFDDWHTPIKERDWELLEYMLKHYDRKRYTTANITRSNSSRSLGAPSSSRSLLSSTSNHSNKSPVPSSSKSRKLKIFKFLPGSKQRASSASASAASSAADYVSDLDETDGSNKLVPFEEQESPLRQVDHMGRTPMHLAIYYKLQSDDDIVAAADNDTDTDDENNEAKIPSKLFQKLLFVERSTASIPCTEQQRYPLHSGILYGGLPKYSLDRLIYAYPNALWALDVHGKTPMYYAVQKAVAVTIKMGPSPKSVKPIDDAWDLVDFLCDTYTSRRAVLRHDCEQVLLERVIKYKAPSYTVEKLMSITNLEQQSKNKINKPLQALLDGDYPVSNIITLLMILQQQQQNSSDNNQVQQQIQNSILKHFQKGMKTTTTTTYCQELLQFEKNKSFIPSKPCQDWWYKLRFCIGYNSTDDLQKVLEMDANYILHTALQLSSPITKLIQFLNQLFPNSKYEVDPKTGLLPMDMIADSTTTDNIKLRRILLVHNNKTTTSPPRQEKAKRDPTTGLYEFQVAAMKGHTVSRIYDLLRADPSAMVDSREAYHAATSSLENLVGPTASTALDWCYYKETDGQGKKGKWVVNRKNVKILQQAIRTGRIPDALKGWWDTMKACIWHRYQEREDKVPLLSSTRSFASSSSSPIRLPQLPRNDDRYLLHAAVLDSDTHPMIIELLVNTNPMSPAMPFPNTDLYPLHVACMADSYAALPFEKATVHNKTSIETIAHAHPSVIEDTSRIAKGRIPLHLAAANGRMLGDLCVLLQYYPASLSIADPVTKLLPFELVAARESWTSISRLAGVHSRMLNTYEISTSKYCYFLRTIRQGQDTAALNSAYHMLRSHPDAMVASACGQETARTNVRGGAVLPAVDTSYSNLFDNDIDEDGSECDDDSVSRLSMGSFWSSSSSSASFND